MRAELAIDEKDGTSPDPSRHLERMREQRDRSFARKSGAPRYYEAGGERTYVSPVGRAAER